MKRVTIMAASIFILFCLHLTLAAPPPGAAATGTTMPAHKLRLALYLPDTPGPDRDSLKWWVSEVDKRSQGRLQILSFWGEGLLKGAETVSGVQNGVVDLGFTSWGYHQDEMAVLLPGGGPNKFHYSSAPAILQAWLQLYREFPQYEATFNGKNQKRLLHVSLASNELFSRKPINAFADLQGLKSRAGGKYEPRIMEAAGCVSVSTSITEAYDSMQKGLIDVMLTSLPLVKQYKFYEVAKHVSLLNAGPTDAVIALTVNKDSWNKLPKESQDILTQVSAEHFKVWSKMHYEYMNEASAFLKSKGVTVSTFPAPDRERWKNLPAVKKLSSDYIAQLNAKGLPGSQINDRFLALEKEMEAKYGPQGTFWK